MFVVHAWLRIFKAFLGTLNNNFVHVLFMEHIDWFVKLVAIIGSFWIYSRLFFFLSDNFLRFFPFLPFAAYLFQVWLAVAKQIIDGLTSLNGVWAKGFEAELKYMDNLKVFIVDFGEIADEMVWVGYDWEAFDHFEVLLFGFEPWLICTRNFCLRLWIFLISVNKPYTQVVWEFFIIRAARLGSFSC
jgi:hypothetical protein